MAIGGGKEKGAKRWRRVEKANEKEFKGRTTDSQIHTKMRKREGQGQLKVRCVVRTLRESRTRLEMKPRSQGKGGVTPWGLGGALEGRR